MKFGTLLWKNGDFPKRVVDFLREIHTVRNKIMEIVEDFECEAKFLHFFIVHHFSSFFFSHFFFVFSLFSFCFHFSFFLFSFFSFFKDHDVQEEKEVPSYNEEMASGTSIGKSMATTQQGQSSSPTNPSSKTFIPFDQRKWSYIPAVKCVKREPWLGRF